MAKISISRNHSLPLPVIKERLTALSAKLKEMKGEATWSSDNAMNVKGPGVEGTLTVAPDKIDVNLTLGMLASAMKGKIEEVLTKQLDQVVKPESAS